MYNLAFDFKGPKMDRHRDFSSKAPDEERRVEPKRDFTEAPKIDPNKVSSLHIEGALEQIFCSNRSSGSLHKEKPM